MTTRETLERKAASVTGQLRDLERECHHEGGFLTSDPRAMRLSSLNREYDEVEDELFDLDMQEAQ